MKKLIDVHDKVFELFISAEEIQKRVQDLGVEIKNRYENKEPLFIGVLNGAFIFAADLIRACEDMKSEIKFVKLSSYEGLKSSGNIVSIIGILSENVVNRDLIIIEDIIDSGKTMTEFVKTLSTYEPNSISIATMFLKPDALEYPVVPDYVGFSIPNKFIIGYGLDYDGLGRNLKDVYQLSE